MTYRNSQRRFLESLSSTIQLSPIVTKTNEYKRRLKGLTEKIKIVNVDIKYESIMLDDTFCYKISGITCEILSSSNNVYNIDVFKHHNKINYKCSCPDFSIRNVNCKHIYWLGYKKFGNTDPLQWDELHYEKFIIEYWILDNYVGNNKICSICLEEIDYESEYTVSCKYVCHNSVHSKCWKQYYDISNKKNCVICRSGTLLLIK